MTKLMAAMLMAAAAMPGLAPGLASAQDWRGGGEHHGEHGQPPHAAQPAAPAQPPQARAPVPMVQQRPTGDPRRFAGGQPFGGQSPGYQGRPGGWDGQRRFPGPGQFAGQPQPAPQGGYRQQFEGRRGGQRAGQPGAYAPDPAYRGDPGARNPFRPDGAGYGGGRGPQGRPYDGVARGNGYGYRGDDHREGQWNRGWHNDGRYDWNSYRRYNSEAFRLPRYAAPYGWNYGYRRFGVGFVLDQLLFAPDYWIDDPYDYRLPPAYGPYRWVRYYGDALLVDIDSGQVVDVVYGMFY